MLPGRNGFLKIDAAGAFLKIQWCGAVFFEDKHQIAPYRIARDPVTKLLVAIRSIRVIALVERQVAPPSIR